MLNSCMTMATLFWIKELGTAMPCGCNDNIKGVDATNSTWWAFSILFQELNVAMVIQEFNIQMLKSPLNQERYKILLMIYFLTYMMVNLLDDSNFHRQTAVMTWFIEIIIQNPVFGISCIISMLAHSTSQCLMSFTNIQKSTECTKILLMIYFLTYINLLGFITFVQSYFHYL
jgi:hypothetical protein